MLYKSIYAESSDSFVVEKSEFIGHICPVRTEEEAMAYIDKIRSENRKARHNCYAYVLTEDNITRYSDDNEPQGTAGLPILDVIKKNGLADVVIVVTRYFGGILLGKGGLTRAYSTGASLAVAAAKVMEMQPAFLAEISCEYSFYDKISHALLSFNVRISDTEYSDKVKITLAVPSQDYEGMAAKLRDITNGSATISKSSEILFDFAE